MCVVKPQMQELKKVGNVNTHQKHTHKHTHTHSNTHTHTHTHTHCHTLPLRLHLTNNVFLPTHKKLGHFIRVSILKALYKRPIFLRPCGVSSLVKKTDTST